MSGSVTQPLDLIRFSLDEEVVVSCRNNRKIQGKLIAFDQHLNLVLSNAKETKTYMEVDPTTGEEIEKKHNREIEILYVRGDVIRLISPMVRT